MSKSFHKQFGIIAIVLIFLSLVLYVNYKNRIELNQKYADRVEKIEAELSNAISILDINFIKQPSLSEFDTKAIESLEKNTLFDKSELSSRLITSIEKHKLKGTLTQDMALQSIEYLEYFISDKELVEISSILGQEYFEKKSKEYRGYPGTKLASLETLMLTTDEATKKMQLSVFKNLLEKDKEKVLKKKIRRFSGPILNRVIINRLSQDLTEMAAIAQGQDGEKIAIKYANQNLIATKEHLKSISHNQENYLILLNNAVIAWNQSPNSINTLNSIAIIPVNETLTFENKKYELYEYCLSDLEWKNCSYYTDEYDNKSKDEPYSSLEARKRIKFYQSVIADYI